MAPRFFFIPIFLVVSFAACSAPELNQAEIDSASSENTATAVSPLSRTIYDTQLFDSARNLGALEFIRLDSAAFLYFRSGKFIEPDVITAIVAADLTDSTIEIQLWSLHMELWTLLSQIEVRGPGVAFSMNYADYNFDGQTDIYQNISTSNGYPQSYGNLLLVDPITLEMTICHEAAALTNMRPDAHTQRIFSSKVIWCEKNGLKDTCVLTHEWIQDSLLTINTKCPCEPE
jgi:hypothetical protein